MPLLLGLDEAGYGPNLGPLVIGVSAWLGPADLVTGDWYAALGPTITSAPGKNCVAMADSKQLYQAGGSLAELECGVLAALALLNRQPRTWRDIWPALERQAAEQVRAPWESAIDLPLPRDLSANTLATTVNSLQNLVQPANPETEPQLLELGARVIYPAEFNALVNRLDSKGALLSQATLELASDVIASLAERFPQEAIYVTCDKHGGRDRYASVLQHVFPEAWIEPLQESRAESRYRFRLGERAVQFRFQAKGERFLPAALASMTAKYLRELAMLAFNDFWQSRIPRLKPTAGYPEDAKRFLTAIQADLDSLTAPRDTLWRKR